MVGAGAVGCFYGSKLAKAGADVHFLMRADLEAVRANGLTIKSTHEDGIHLPAVNAYSRPEEIGPVDLVIIALKATSNAALEQLLPPLLKESTSLITLQNGLGNEAFLAERFGVERVMGALCFVCLNRTAPGVIEHFGHGTISLGEYEGAPQARTRALTEALHHSGVEARLVENLMEERWRKLIWNIPFNGLSIAAGGITTDVILQDAGLEELVRGLMRETAEIAKACRFLISDDYLELQIKRTRPMGAYKPSSLLDYWAGNPVEVEAIWGEALRQARAKGVPAGRLEALYFLLKRLCAAR